MFKIIREILDTIGANIGIYAIVFAFGASVSFPIGWKLSHMWYNGECDARVAAVKKEAEDNKLITEKANADLQNMYADLGSCRSSLVRTKRKLSASQQAKLAAIGGETIGSTGITVNQLRGFVEQHCDRYYGERIALEQFQSDVWRSKGQ